MKELFESFRKYQEQRDQPSDIDAYRMSGLLVIAKRLKRKKFDILSDIRAIEGVTTVSVEAHRVSANLEFSEVKIKIDTTPIAAVSMAQAVASISREISRVRGVQSFKIVTRPEVL